MKKFIFGFCLITSTSVLAQVSVTIQPTEDELFQYLSEKNLITEVATNCLQDTWNTHLDFFKKYKISKYYGDRNPKLAKTEQRLEVIKKVGAPVSILDQLEPTSCIGLTRKCLKNGFEATQNQTLISLWNRIDEKVIANGVSGVVLIQNLQKLGWKVLYWNPNPEENTKWDQEDVRNLTAVKVVNWESGIKNAEGQFVYHPGWGMHASRYQQVMKSNKYYTVNVDDKKTLVGMKDQIPTLFKNSPLFVGVAHAGYHVFPGFFGEVIEAHSMRRLDSIDNMEKASFNPYRGGAPMWSNTEKYRSGIVAVPPGVMD